MVNANDTEGLVYQWMKEDYLNSERIELTGENDTELEVSEGGHYIFTVKDTKYGGYEYECSFNVYVDNNFYLNVENSCAKVLTDYGSNAVLRIFAYGNDTDDVRMQWYEYDKDNSLVKLEGETANSLAVENVIYKRTFVCKAIDKYGNSGECTIDVSVSNGFTAAIKGAYNTWPRVFVTKGSSQDFEVEASADEGDITYKWVGEAYNDEDGNYYDQEMLGNEPILHIDNLAYERNYYCDVSDKYGSNERLYFSVDFIDETTDINLNETLEFYPENQKVNAFRFTPSYSGIYRFEFSSENWMITYITDESHIEKKQVYISEGGETFIQYYMEEGETYYCIAEGNNCEDGRVSTVNLTEIDSFVVNYYVDDELLLTKRFTENDDYGIWGDVWNSESVFEPYRNSEDRVFRYWACNGEEFYGPLTSDIDLHAVFGQIYTVTYHLYDDVVEVRKVVEGEYPTHFDNLDNFVLFDDKRFDHWETADGEYFNEPIVSDIDLYAKFRTLYTIFFYMDDGTPITEVKVEEGQYYSADSFSNDGFIPNIPEGKAFDHWENRETGQRWYGSEITGDMYLYAVFTKAVKITYHNSDGSVLATRSVNPDDWYVYSWEFEQVFGRDITPERMNFLYWSRTLGGKPNNMRFEEDGDLYAVFGRQGINVTFDPNGGEVTGDNVLYLYGNQNYDVNPDDVSKPVRNGYIFSGWSYSATENIPFERNSDYIFDDFTLYAYWIQEGKGEINVNKYGDVNDLEITITGIRTYNVGETANITFKILDDHHYISNIECPNEYYDGPFFEKTISLTIQEGMNNINLYFGYGNYEIRFITDENDPDNNYVMVKTDREGILHYEDIPVLTREGYYVRGWQIEGESYYYNFTSPRRYGRLDGYVFYPVWDKKGVERKIEYKFYHAEKPWDTEQNLTEYTPSNVKIIGAATALSGNWYDFDIVVNEGAAVYGDVKVGDKNVGLEATGHLFRFADEMYTAYNETMSHSILVPSDGDIVINVYVIDTIKGTLLKVNKDVMPSDTAGTVTMSKPGETVTLKSNLKNGYAVDKSNPFKELQAGGGVMLFNSEPYDRYGNVYLDKFDLSVPDQISFRGGFGEFYYTPNIIYVGETVYTDHDISDILKTDKDDLYNAPGFVFYNESDKSKEYTVSFSVPVIDSWYVPHSTGSQANEPERLTLSEMISVGQGADGIGNTILYMTTGKPGESGNKQTPYQSNMLKTLTVSVGAGEYLICSVVSQEHELTRNGMSFAVSDETGNEVLSGCIFDGDTAKHLIYEESVSGDCTVEVAVEDEMPYEPFKVDIDITGEGTYAKGSTMIFTITPEDGKYVSVYPSFVDRNGEYVDVELLEGQSGIINKATTFKYVVPNQKYIKMIVYRISSMTVSWETMKPELVELPAPVTVGIGEKLSFEFKCAPGYALDMDHPFLGGQGLGYQSIDGNIMPFEEDPWRIGVDKNLVDTTVQNHLSWYAGAGDARLIPNIVFVGYDETVAEEIQDIIDTGSDDEYSAPGIAFYNDSEEVKEYTVDFSLPNQSASVPGSIMSVAAVRAKSAALNSSVTPVEGTDGIGGCTLYVTIGKTGEAGVKQDPVHVDNLKSLNVRIDAGEFVTYSIVVDKKEHELPKEIKYEVKDTEGNDVQNGYITEDDTYKHLISGEEAMTVLTPAFKSSSMNTTGVTLKWNATENADKYIVYRKTGTESYEEVGRSDTASFTDKTALAGVKYTYTVKALNSRTLISSDYSAGKTVTYNPFKDVKSGTAHYKNIMWAFNVGLVNGTSKTTFSPEGTCMRKSFAIMLWKLNGRPSAGGTNPFTDLGGLTKNEKAAIQWCYKNKIVNGLTKTTFGPEGDVTRKAVVIMLWKAAGKPAPTITVKDSKFTDISKLTKNEQSAILWAFENGITKGMTKTTFGPEENCTREQLCTFLARYNNLLHIMD